MKTLVVSVKNVDSVKNKAERKRETITAQDNA